MAGATRGGNRRGKRGERESSSGEEEIREGEMEGKEIGETWEGLTTMASRALVMER